MYPSIEHTTSSFCNRQNKQIRIELHFLTAAMVVMLREEIVEDETVNKQEERLQISSTYAKEKSCVNSSYVQYNSLQASMHEPRIS